MATKQKAIKDVFEALKAKEIIVPLTSCTDTYTTANDWCLMITVNGCEWNVLNMQERKRKIAVDFDVLGDISRFKYSLDDIVEYRLFTEVDKENKMAINMQNTSLQFLLKLVETGAVSVDVSSVHTKLTVNRDKFEIRYQDSDEDFSVQDIVVVDPLSKMIITDTLGTELCGVSVDNLSHYHFFVYKLVSIYS